MNETITIAGASFPATRYNRLMIRRLFSLRGWWLAVPAAAVAVAAATLPAQWAVATGIVALSALILLFPIVYFRHSLSPRAGWAIAEKDVTIDNSGIHLNFADPRRTPKDLAWSEFAAVMKNAGHYLLVYRAEPEAFIALPITAFDSRQLAWLIEKIHSN